MQLLHQLNNLLLRLASWGVILSMAAIAIVIPYEVFGRYVLSRMSVWSAEFSQYALVWASMMGGAVGLKKGYQVGITTLTDKLPPVPAKVVQGIGCMVMLVFLALMSIYGIEQTMMNINQASSTIGISMSIPYAALPLGFIIMLFITVEQFLEVLGVNPARRE